MLNMEIYFDDWTFEQRLFCLVEKINTELIVDKSTLGFDQYEKREEFELPPVFSDDTELRTLILLTADISDSKKRWFNTLFEVYSLGGKVFYKRYNDASYVAAITFPRT